jgi:quinol monooxygenase YgiN
MILERAEIVIKDGLMAEFLEVFVTRALPLTRTFSGCLSFEALRGVEQANSIMFLTRWESFEAHMNSRLESDHTEFRELVLPYTTGAKETVHFAPIGSLAA